MTIDEMRERKRALGYSNKMISDLSGVPLGTVQKIFAGITKNPQWATLRNLEKVFRQKDSEYSYTQDTDDREVLMFRENAPRYGDDPGQGNYTIEDYYALPDERRVELIEGFIYDMVAPSAVHQLVLLGLALQFAPCVDKHPECELFLAPCDVRLDNDDRTMVQPDLFIICEKDQITRKRINGAPDFVIEILSPSNEKHDLHRKLEKYSYAGVREYWIVHPEKLYILVHDLENNTPPVVYSFRDEIPVGISDGECTIDFKVIYKKIEPYLQRDESE